MAEDDGRQQEYEDRKRHDGRRVDAGKALYPLLGGGAARVRLFDHADDAGERGVLGGLSRPDRQRAVAIDRAGKDFRAGLLLHRDALAGDGRLIDGAGACCDPAIKRDAFACWNDEAVTEPDFGDRHDFFRSVRPKHARGRRGEIEQRRDGPACPSDTPAFQRQRQCEKE